MSQSIALKPEKVGYLDYEAVYYNGKAICCPKLHGKFPQSLKPEDLLEKIEPALARIGVTMLSNITGLDRIGIPVVNAIRPLFNGMSVSHGKGITITAAMASAAMESVERYCAIVTNVPSFEMTYHELQKHYSVIPLEKLPISKNSLFSPQYPETWTIGWDIINQEKVAVPLGLVSMQRAPYDLDSFQRSTNGLAAGFNMLEAISQALFEAIERDAVTCSYYASYGSGSPFLLHPVNHEAIEFDNIQKLLTMIEGAGVIPLLFDCTVDTNVPTYECRLLDKTDIDMSACKGWGASLDPQVAMSRAITEAVQARAIWLSGIREAFFQCEMESMAFSDTKKIYSNFKAAQASGKLAPVAGNSEKMSGSSFQEDIRRCVELLKKAGIDQIIVVDITEQELDLSVVRVICPGLEGVHELIYYSPGKRAISYMKEESI